MHQTGEGVLAEHVDARVQLDLAGAVHEVEERGLARAAPRGDTPGDAVGVLGLLACGEVIVGGEDRRDRLRVRERVGERLGIGRSQPLRLRAALGDQLVQAVRGAAVGLGLVVAAHSGETT